ncbi:MAG: ankyrin repeat domain-containing protein [Treponema sp.]|nr:ankyrin repeat domain-containing protein [Treponema sp.]
MICMTEDNKEYVEWLLEDPSRIKKRYRQVVSLVACEYCDEESMKKLVSAGFDINGWVEQRAWWLDECYSSDVAKLFETPLMIALKNGNTTAAKSLIECGCDIFVESAPEGETAIFYAARDNNVEILKILLDKGEDINRCSWASEHSPIFEAAACGAEEAVDYLLERGADISISNLDDETVDLIAAKNDHMEIAKKLHKAVLEQMKSRNVSAQRLGFNKTFWKFVNDSEISLTKIYKSVELSRMTFSKIKSAGEDYKPKKENVLRLAIGLKLDESKASELLASAGYFFDSDSVRDSVVLRSIRSGEYRFYAIESEIERAAGKLLARYE